jgi:hypothetical protein
VAIPSELTPTGQQVSLGELQLDPSGQTLPGFLVLDAIPITFSITGEVAINCVDNTIPFCLDMQVPFSDAHENPLGQQWLEKEQQVPSAKGQQLCSVVDPSESISLEQHFPFAHCFLI